MDICMFFQGIAFIVYPGNKETATRTNCTVSAAIVASRAIPRVWVGCPAKSGLILSVAWNPKVQIVGLQQHAAVLIYKPSFQRASSAARPVEHHKTSSAEQPADDFGAVVLKGLLADREWQ